MLERPEAGREHLPGGRMYPFRHRLLNDFHGLDGPRLSRRRAVGAFQAIQ